ncbi:MAG: PSD1 and planctomycete cytochrome C domain-containing protein [Rubripirellula sp.]|nr:PSD1 and planctomycete cytochrome C domain-containing protein [Rubripirellula sp.]
MSQFYRQQPIATYRRTRRTDGVSESTARMVAPAELPSRTGLPSEVKRMKPSPGRSASQRYFACIGSLVITLASAVCVDAQPVSESPVSESPVSQEASAERLFTLRVLPLLREKCFGCHGGDSDDLRGDYDLLTRAGMLRGGESEEPSLVPGEPDKSSLYLAVLWDGLEMPPKENDRLDEQQAGWVRQWIEAGAPWPDRKRQQQIQQAEWAVTENQDGVIVATSTGASDDWTYRRYLPEDLWAFRPVEKPAVPEAAGHPVDAFVKQRLDQVGLAAAGQADPRSLIRRATYDLTGLPPTPREITEFRNAYQQDREAAWESLLERLLESQHYGERWAQHWLDVVRYADTAGFSNDYELSNLWRYRDYVIRSFNQDKPFNEFAIEQIAGDEWRPEDPEARIATGLLRLGPWGTAMIPKEEARQMYLDDLVHNVGQAFLSMPMRCCKCHDHKFDPIPTRDYYQLYAALATTQPAEIDCEFLPEENRGQFSDSRKRAEELLMYAKAKLKQVNDKQEAAALEWYEARSLPYKNEKQRRNDAEDAKPPRHVGLTPEDQGRKKVREQDVWIWERRLNRYKPMVQSVYSGQMPKSLNSRYLRMPKIDEQWRPETFILVGGALQAKGDPVQPGVLSATAVSVSPDEQTYLITADLRGRRLALAKWITDDANPLTARSIVNRVWQYHFNVGLVKTANNFGVKGSKPTHPELLDWLTADFIQNGWKLKRLHRLIMSSQTYQRSSRAIDTKKQATVDPNNDWLASFRPRRLTAEELRDTTLAVSGELNREQGGLPAMPEINLEVALQPRMIQFSIAPAYQPSPTPKRRNRRTIYTYRVRGQADPMLEVMNLPNPNESCELRESAAVTPQAFTLMNSEAMTDRSIAFASRVQRERPGDTQAWIKRAVHLAYGRPATKVEQDQLHTYLKAMQVYHVEHEPQSREYPTEITRSLVEEFTGEPFEFIEKLNVYDDYVADPKPWTVNADQRALADVCLLLLNSNEFVYLY